MAKRVGLARSQGDHKQELPSLNSVGFLLLSAQLRLRDAVVEAIEGSGLNPGQLAVLGALSDCGGMSQRRLGALTGIEKSSMVLMIDALEHGRWVSRKRDPSDRRAHIVELTSQGAIRFAELGPRLRSAQQKFLKPLNATEVDALTEMLKRIGGPPA